MAKLDIAQQRLHNQALASVSYPYPSKTAPAGATAARSFKCKEVSCERPVAVVRWFGAVQAQDYYGSLWAIGQRMQSANEAMIEQAMADGVIVRTHPMRGTWHFVAADDIRWLLALMAPRRIASLASWYRRLELDDATIARSKAVMEQTLRGRKQLTRRELAAALQQAGVATNDLRLTFLLSHAELEGVIASGARRGKQLTFALLDEVVPASRMLERDEALAELAERYFTSHGPATIQDFAWWSGLTLTDARAGLATVREKFVKEEANGQTYWLSPSTPTGAIEGGALACLLPAYDEYTVAYRDRGAVLDPAYAEQTGNGIFSPILVVNGRVAGTWKRTLKQDTVNVQVALMQPLSTIERQALEAAAERYGRFLGKSATLLYGES